ncbi:glycosyltransferase family 4 protein [Flavobacterium sp. 83]|uniref:glycosyltransferase family 4 protein n=1 Tax=Flavobacterium sp. 83 TaxID=1131812 RepID=UPI00054EDFBF|nr:glycosyltransferase family 4 protein [Flavobacterium sp. 83]
MKILHILNGTDIGGIERFVYYLAKAQSKNKSLEVGVFFCKKEGELISLFLDIDIKRYFIDIDAFDLNLVKYTKMNSIAKHYDVVHIHSFRPIRDLLFYFNSNKVIFTNHSVLGFGRAVKRTDFLKWSLFKFFSNRKKIFLTFNSKYTEDFWRKRGVKNENSSIIYNGVSFRDVKNRDLRSVLNLNDKFIIGTSSRLIEWKRIDLLIKAFCVFQHNKKSAFLLIVGDGNEKGRLQELVKSLGMSEKVLFTGNVINVEDYQFMMDVCVFPSTTEAFGLVAIECMEYGKPVLVMADGGGITEVVEKLDESNVCDDMDSLIENLERYFNNQDLLKGKYFEERVAFSKEFDMNLKENEFFDVYKLMLCNKK